MQTERAEAFFLCERRRRRILDVRATDLQEEMAEQRFSALAAPRKTAATQRTSPRAERTIQYLGALCADDVEIVTEPYVIFRHSDDSLGRPARTSGYRSSEIQKAACSVC